MKKFLNEKILKDNKKTLFFISALVFFALFCYQIILLCCGTYFNGNSDDILQYSPILSQYIDYIKSGELSFFNYSNNLGMSVFADVYYIPIDIFSLFVFLLSFIVKNEVAFSIVELVKVFVGVSTFAYLLQKCRYKNSTVLILSLAYFCLGGSWAFCVFPTYFSLFFYLPFSLLIVKWYCEGKRWLLPLYCVILIFYNFYNAYSLYIFMLLTYIVICIRDNYSGFKHLIKDAFFFGIHIIVGVVMGLVILIPSILYILGCSVRGSGNFVFVFPYQVYFRMIAKLFIIEGGSLNFLGGAGDVSKYEYTHFSFYIGVIGLIVLSFLFHMKDRVSRIYKWTTVAIIVMMICPIFSMVFSGYGTPYLRWICFINIILLFFIGHVLENAKWESFTFKQKVTNFSVLGVLYSIALTYNAICLGKESLISQGGKSLYYITILLLCLDLIILYAVFYLSKQKQCLYVVAAIELICALILNMIGSVQGSKGLNIINFKKEVNELINHLELKSGSLDRIYLSEGIQNNNGRFFNGIVSEKTFHSFINENIYDYTNLYADEEEALLYISNVNLYSPIYSRSVNYKYIVINKERKNDRLNYLPIYYEDDNYIVYENVDYEPFYVYENYYKYDEVYALRDSEDYIELNKKLFKGVILDTDQYNLNYLSFDYNDSLTKEISVYNELVLEEKENNRYFSDFTRFNLSFEGYVIIKGDSYEGIEDIRIIDGEKAEICKEHLGKYYCKHDGSFNGIEVVGNNKASLNYSFVIKDEDDEYFAVYEFEDINEGYLEYYIRSQRLLYYIDKTGKVASCLHGYCQVSEHIKYGLIDASFEGKSEYSTLYYQQNNLEYYNLNKEDKSAVDKSLTYKGSLINVKYKNISTSSNDQVVVLPITYSEEWVCDNENYELVRANGAYLGLLVKNGVENIDVNIVFKPKGLKAGLIGSLFGIAIYGVYIFLMNNRKRRGRVNETA